MERFVKGDVVVLPFPFSDLSKSKRRPALVLANMEYEDILLCQITSKKTRDSLAVELSNEDFLIGSLPSDSFIRPGRIFTADRKIIIKKAGTLAANKMNLVIESIIKLLND
jgi:mRNA interferase MazF